MSQNELFLKKVEDLIRLGKFAEAKKLMSSVPRSGLKPDQVLKLAQFARRSDQANLALLLLRPFMDFKVIMSPQKFPDIQIEYAASLIKRGVIAPAMHILEKFDPAVFPKILLFQAFGLFAEWNYESAIPILIQYCDSNLITEYERAVGKVNLAAAYLGSGQSKAAEGILFVIIPWLQEQSHLLLAGNCYELMAQAELQSGDYEKANLAIEKAEKILGPEKSRYRLATGKWKLVLKAKQKLIANSQLVAEFEHLHKEALERNDFETLRDTEAWLACLLKDEKLFRKVYFGSSFMGYRQNILKTFSEKIELRNCYFYQLGDGNNLPLVDFFSPNHSEEHTVKDMSGITKGLCQLLCSDFYKPFSVGRIFNHLFPFDLFDPLQDAHRIYEIVRRTNFWLESQEVPLRIDSTGFGYKVQPLEPCQILVPVDAAVVSECFERALLRNSDKKSFSAKQACQWTGTPLTTTIRKLNGLISSGYLFKENSGKNTKYVWRDLAQSSVSALTKAG